MTNYSKPSLFGLNRTNRDFASRANWGKNIFNNAFPIALACYMHSRQMPLVYIKIDANGAIEHDTITVEQMFGMSPENLEIFYAFEADFTPYQPLVIGRLPRADVVVMNTTNGTCKCALEIKLTALPDNTTCDLPEDRYGSEIVVRPDTIVYLALSIVSCFKTNLEVLSPLFNFLPNDLNWENAEEVLPLIAEMVVALETLMQTRTEIQQPLILQPIWKTEGKKLSLHQHAFDIFVWSNVAFMRLFLRESQFQRHTLSRGMRSIIWLTKMLYDFGKFGRFDHRRIIDRLSFNTKNDKAFAVNGTITHSFMKSPQLLTPRVKREEIRNIILGGGEAFLSPERTA